MLKKSHRREMVSMEDTNSETAIWKEVGSRRKEIPRLWINFDPKNT